MSLKKEIINIIILYISSPVARNYKNSDYLSGTKNYIMDKGEEVKKILMNLKLI
jgi:hypothetical protein